MEIIARRRIEVANVAAALALLNLQDGEIVQVGTGVNGALRVFSSIYGRVIPSHCYEGAAKAVHARITGSVLPNLEQTAWTDNETGDGEITQADGEVTWNGGASDGDFAYSSLIHGVLDGNHLVAGYFQANSFVNNAISASLWVRQGTKVVYVESASSGGPFTIRTSGARAVDVPANAKTYIEFVVVHGVGVWLYLGMAARAQVAAAWAAQPSGGGVGDYRVGDHTGAGSGVSKGSQLVFGAF